MEAALIPVGVLVAVYLLRNCYLWWKGDLPNDSRPW